MSESVPLKKLDKFQYSTTKRRDLKQCPQMYYRKHVAKDYPFEETAPILIGRLIDTSLETSIKSGETLDLNLLKRQIIQIDPAYKYVDTLVDGTDAALAYCIDSTGLKATQSQFAVDITARPCKVNWTKRSKLFDAAKPDFLCLHAPEHFTCVDWKTGNPDYPESAIEQLEDYSIHLFAHFPLLQKVSGRVGWLRKGKHVDPEKYMYFTDHEINRPDARAIFERWAAHHIDVKNMNSSGDWKHKKNGLCDWCVHYDNCEAHKL